MSIQYSIPKSDLLEPKAQHKTPCFSHETKEALRELGVVLEGIYRRMRSEGYDIIGDRIINIKTGEEYEPPKDTKRKYAKRY